MKNSKHCGYVAIVGRPNVGKSTLLNCLLGKKISITTPKPQTTRTQILGIKSDADNQVVYIDTPGIHDDQKKAMNRYMNRLAGAVIKDADAVIFMVQADHWNREDELVLSELSFTKAPVLLVVNMIDKLSNKAEVLPYIKKLQSKFDFAEVIPLSALKAENVSALETEIIKFLPEGPHLFPDDQHTDVSIRFQIAEIIREKIIQATEQELPYSTTVEIENLEEDERLMEISAIIWVERDGQKPIVIGKDGTRLKKIGTQSRKDMEKLLSKKVFLRLWVKVKENWADDDRALRSLGYQ